MGTDKVAIVTGGSRGIGQAISSQLAKEGYRVVVFGRSDYQNVKADLELIGKNGQDPLYIQGSLADKQDRENLCNQVLSELGRIDVLVNNAGVAPPTRLDLLDTTEESFDFVLDTNLKGTFFLTQSVAKIMVKQVQEGLYQDRGFRPKIVNISSISAYTSSTLRGEYCISKAGISMMTKLFADRLAEYGIYSYEVRPGIIQTDMTKAVKGKYDKLISDGLTPIDRWGYPQDIANAVSVLCSDMLSFSTGEVINVDGGFHLRRL